ncbi:polycomb group RING finger protein 3-like [Mya arenaria]|uniref:polycomb group RING finger protein 3-like n=1 Tax=Mya arenaria TaxID=6604 RepID=UPI0022E5D1A5|nr:polycomb group RING finger protein 3-like [Mya arenaria]XP_052772873.1 polycomb group RING finger protein 3-like [Mya arenaria]XP_052772874.1 polycomb group RING finger protein 3-like [Mya arenaria]
MMEKRAKLKKVNPEITCGLCKGYLVEATTITECLHTFCRSCLVKFLLENNTCPRCGDLIHQSHPLNYISHDRTMQDIVYKLVPNLQENERKRQIEFYKKRGIQMPNGDAYEEDKKNMEKSPPKQVDNKDFHRLDEQVNICLECKEINTLKSLKRRILRLSSLATVTHLKKFVALKVFDTIDRYKDVDILCNEELLGKDHMLKFIIATRWRNTDGPLLLHYRRKMEL